MELELERLWPKTNVGAGARRVGAGALQWSLPGVKTIISEVLSSIYKETVGRISFALMKNAKALTPLMSVLAHVLRVSFFPIFRIHQNVLVITNGSGVAHHSDIGGRKPNGSIYLVATDYFPH